MLTGAVQLKAQARRSPEKKKVIDKLRLKGEFGLSKATFTDPEVQTKLTGLSRRAQGKTQEEELGEVLSNLRGAFVLENSEARFSRLTFSVPGATDRTGGTLRPARRNRQLSRQSPAGGDALTSGRRRSERLLPQGVRSDLQETRAPAW